MPLSNDYIFALYGTLHDSPMATSRALERGLDRWLSSSFGEADYSCDAPLYSTEDGDKWLVQRLREATLRRFVESCGGLGLDW